MNKVFLIGRLTGAPEIMVSGDNNSASVAKFALAVDRKYRKDNDENTANFFRCVAFGSTAAFIEKYIFKGQKIAIIGRLESGSYVNSEGIKIYTTDVIIEEVDFAESKRVVTNESDV